MVMLRVSVLGADVAARNLEAIADRFDGDLRPLLGPVGESIASGVQDRIRKGELDLPPISPQTAAIRRYYGHGAKERLVRGGDLIRSVRVLEVGNASVAVGSDLSFAATLQSGGINRTGQTVRPHPFLSIPAEDVDDAAETILDYILSGGRAA